MPALILEEGKTYRIRNSVKGFEDIYLADTKEDAYLRWTTSADDDSALWLVATAELKSDGTQAVRLQNVQTQRYIYSNGTKGSGQLGWPVRMATARNTLSIGYNVDTDDYSISLNKRNFFPIMRDGTELPGIVSSGTTISGAEQPARPQGSAWTFEVAQADGIGSTPLENLPREGRYGGASYDLQGRELTAEPQHGVFIKGGKKVAK